MVSKKTLKPSDYVHLHNHTQYSLLDGLTKVPELIDKVEEFGMEAVAITDHGTMSGVVEFYKVAKAKGLNPIIGIETYIARRRYTDKDPAKDKNPYHLTLLAMNKIGYKNLMKLSTIANLDGFYYRPRIDHELLEKYSEGLIVLSGCIGGEVGEALREGLHKQAAKIAKWYKNIFGDRYYLEIQDHGHKEHPTSWPEQVEVTAQTLKIAKDLKIDCVLTCDAHYLNHEDQDAHEILLCVQTGAFLADQDRMSLKNLELHVTDPNEVIKRWGKSHPDLITNTRKIAQRCNVELELNKILIPSFPLPKNETEKTFLEKLVYQGLAWRYGGISRDKAAKMSISATKKTLRKDILNRAAYEIDMVDRMKFNGFYLIVADFINWGKAKGIVFGPGRGSAASSIMAYALNITELDPLEYDLLFERFLNPDRISMPDFDIDIQDSRRDEVIEYCIDKYGSDRVANIVTFGRMAARNAVRDVARVLQVPYGEADRIAKMIPPPIQGRHIPLKDSLQSDLGLKEEYKSNEQSARVFDLAMQLEGTIRSHGVHAAGVVIAPDNIVNYVPLEMAQKGVIATQYSMGPIEDLGLLKIDFLGLSNLTIIKNTLRIVKKVYKKAIDIDQIPLDDTETFRLLALGDTTGVFQLESAGMKRFLKELKPNQFTDIIAMVALYRPGPMAEFPRFIAGKNNPRSITYPHESLESILKETYGVIVFQEQIIALLQQLAGYSPGEADLVRKAIGKKQRDIMEAEKPRFIKGCAKQGLSSKEAENIWKLIQPFADYSFNKAHAACYALIAYQTAYLKAHYPEAFMAALMTSDFDNTDRLSIEINECKHMGIEVLPPDINQSFMEFAIVPGKKQIRYGLPAVKNVGSAAVEEILRVREDNSGKFESLEDFFGQVNPRIVNRKVCESLIKSGAFDSFGERGVLLFNIDVLLAYANNTQKRVLSGQTDLFGSETSGLSSVKIILESPSEEMGLNDHMQWERELLGLYLSRHPLEDHLEILSKRATAISSIKDEHHGQSLTLGGLIIDKREIVTKNGQKMAFVKLADEHGEMELILFPKLYQQNIELWQTDKVILAKGKVTSRDRSGKETGEIKLLVDSAKLLDLNDKVAAENEAGPPSFSQSSERVYIRLPNSDDQEKLLSLKQTIDQYQGDTEVVLVIGEPANGGGNAQIIKLPIKMDRDKKALTDIEVLVGKENVRVA